MTRVNPTSDAPDAPDAPELARARRARRSALALALLLALTVAAGAAARRWAAPDAQPLPAVCCETPLVAPGGGPVHLSARLDRGAVLRGGDGLVRMELVIAGDESADAETAVRVPTDLVVVLDRSGSMSGEPLRHARAAVRELLAQLGREDRFALVSYASGARVDVSLTAAGEAASASLALAARHIEARGGTNMSGGLDLANQIVAAARADGRAVRVILLSDGHANEGDASRDGLVARARRAVGGEWVLSAVGVGEGFDESLMSALADAGTGNFYYLRHAQGLARVFAGEFDAARETLASGLVVRVDTGPGVELVDAAGYPLERAGRTALFRPGSLFAGQERRLWLSFRLPVDGAAGAGPFPLGSLSLAYTLRGEPHTLALPAPPAIALQEREEDVLAAMNAAAWEEGVLVDEWNALKRDVARAVRDGDYARALGDIEAYEVRNRALAGRLGSAAVAGQLDEARALGEKVERAFEPGAAAPSRQNALSKDLTQESRDGRRVGAKKQR